MELASTPALAEVVAYSGSLAGDAANFQLDPATAAKFCRRSYLSSKETGQWSEPRTSGWISAEETRSMKGSETPK